MSESRFVDLHVHTNFSDSTFTPAEVITAAREEGLSALGITDHDTVSALATITESGKKTGIEIVPGLELSAEKDGEEVHILGYYISWKEDWFRKRLAELSREREKRAREIVRRLNEIGIDLKFELVKEISGEGAIGRMHIARALVSLGYIKDVTSAFRLYIGNSSPCYVKKFPLTPAEAIEMIRQVKGISSLAHPGLLRNKELIIDVIKSGIDGLEVFYPEHTNTMTDNLQELACKNRLLITGGSDCHGLGKGEKLLGKIKLPYKYLTALKAAKQKQAFP